MTDSHSATADELSVAESCNRLARRLHSEILKTTDGNVVLGAFSVASAVAAIWLGAAGRTAAEIQGAFESDLPEDRFHAAIGRLLNRPHAGGIELHCVTNLWVQDGYTLRGQFLTKSRGYYAAEPRTVDFQQRPADAARTINESIARETVGRISELVSPTSISPLSRLILTNAAYLGATWEFPFDSSRTIEQPFWLTRDDRISVPMMTRREEYRVSAGPGFKALALPYEARVSMDEFEAGPASTSHLDLEMLILIPNNRDGLPSLQRTYLDGDLDRLLAAGKMVDIRVCLPRFASSTDEIFSTALFGCGLKSLFDEHQADFSRATDDPRGLRVSELIHTTSVKVDEYGTVAIAATAIEFIELSVRSPPARRLKFVVDRPFLFDIRERRTGLIHYLGRVTDPRG